MAPPQSPARPPCTNPSATETTSSRRQCPTGSGESTPPRPSRLSEGSHRHTLTVSRSGVHAVLRLSATIALLAASATPRGPNSPLQAVGSVRASCLRLPPSLPWPTTLPLVLGTGAKRRLTFFRGKSPKMQVKGQRPFYGYGWRILNPQDHLGMGILRGVDRRKGRALRIALRQASSQAVLIERAHCSSLPLRVGRSAPQQ